MTWKTKTVEPVVDQVTGEIIGTPMLIPPKPQKHKDPWMKIMLPGIDLLALDKDLTGEDYRVLLAYMKKLDWDNYLRVSQTELAKYLGMQKSHFSRSTRKLVEKEILIEGPKIGRQKTFRLSPNIGWKGDPDDHEIFQAEVLKQSRRKQSREKAQTTHMVIPLNLKDEIEQLIKQHRENNQVSKEA